MQLFARPVFFILFVIFSLASYSQSVEQQLANQYMLNAEYEKAVVLFEKLLDQDAKNIQNYQSLLKCYTMLKQYDDALKLTSKQAKKNDEFPQFRVDLGHVYELKKDSSKANQEFEKAIKNLTPDANAIMNTASAFEEYAKYKWMAMTYERGSKLLKDDNIFLAQLAKAYISYGDYKNAIQAYLNYLNNNPHNVQLVKNTFQSLLDNKKLTAELESQIYTKLQKDADNEVWNDLAIWLAIQQNDFENALLQVMAIDKRKAENGRRVMEVSRMARRERSYSDAIKGYLYVIEKGKGKTDLYSVAENEILSTRKEQIESTTNWSDSDAIGLKKDYQRFFTDYGKNAGTASLILEYAEVLSNYVHDIDGAIETLEELIALGNIANNVKNTAKLRLGDYYVMIDEVWEALLLYGQVDLDEKDSPLGEEARFKHARMFYFKGDFGLARELLDVLKSATSELIANDALSLSVFIIDNLGTDSVSVPMEMFASAELLMMQNKLDPAIETMDTIFNLYKGHSLTDDIYYTKAKIYIKKRDYKSALEMLELVIKNYKNDILGDDAMFLMAQIYEENLMDKDKAKQYYKELLITYKDSVYLVEARKRYRKLRGDKYEEEM